MTDHRPIKALQALIGTLSGHTSTERRYLYKLVENVVLYDRVIDGVSAAMDINDVDEELDELYDEWYDIQKAMYSTLDEDAADLINTRVIPMYRIFRRRNAKNG